MTIAKTPRMVGSPQVSGGSLIERVKPWVKAARQIAGKPNA
jgi:hypothetical protein